MGYYSTKTVKITVFCDIRDCNNGGRTYTGETEHEAIQAAKLDGWRIKYGLGRKGKGISVCPEHRTIKISSIAK